MKQRDFTKEEFAAYCRGEFRLEVDEVIHPAWGARRQQFDIEKELERRGLIQKATT